MNRREFITLVGACVGAAASASATPNILQAVIRPKTQEIPLDVTFAHGLKNLNGHIYGPELWTIAAERAKGGRLFLTLPNDSGRLILNDVCGYISRIDIRPDDKYGYRATGRVRALDVPAGEILKKLHKERLSVYMASSGMGTVDGDGFVHNFVDSHFFLTVDPAFEGATPIRLEE